MAITKKALNEALRNRYSEKVIEFLKSENEEILITGSNEIAIPCVDDEGNDEFMVIVFKVPTGSRDGDPYDGYAMEQEYKLKLAEKERKAKENAEKKAKKIAKDKKMREERAKAKAEREE